MSLRHLCVVPVLAATLALGGCAAPLVSLDPPAHPASARDYSRIYERWTRVGRTLSRVEFDTMLLLSATLRSPEFQDAYCARYAQLYDLHGPDLEALRQTEARRATDTFTFAVQAQGHSYGWTDLTTTRSLWRVYLSDDAGHVIAPTSVEMARAQKLSEAALFDHTLSGPFTRAFQVVFPRVGPDGQPTLSPATKRLTLTFAGPSGRIDLNWTLAR